MPPWRPLQLVILIFGIGTALWNILPLPKRTLTFQEQNCACKIPYNWTIHDNPKFLLDAHQPFGGVFTIDAKPASPYLKIESPIFSDALKSNLRSTGCEIVSENRTPFQGHPAYAYTMRKTYDGKLIYTHSINFVAGKYRYDLITARKDSDPANDAQLKAAVDSFGLIDPPSPDSSP